MKLYRPTATTNMSTQRSMSFSGDLGCTEGISPPTLIPVFFLDSRTTPATVAAEQAEQVGVPTLSRHVFLDHDPSPEAIREALLQAAERSRSEPTVTIAHPSQVVVEVLREELPRLHARGVAVYPLSHLLAAPSRG